MSSFEENDENIDNEIKKLNIGAGKYDELEEGELPQEDEYDPEDVIRANGDSIFKTQINELHEYLMAKDFPTMNYPGIAYSKCPKILDFSALPGLYYIRSVIPYKSASNSEFTSGRIYFISPKGREQFLEDWENKYSKHFPNVEILSLDNCVQTQRQTKASAFVLNPKRVYSREQFLSWKTDRRCQVFKHTLDHMSRIELLTLFK
uniref:GIY-YIG homing endonuclease n=1 Tax=Panagrolaimus sp. JU765 TaxID=591449 RepID=A0AC34RGH7_9BILA